MDRCQYERKLSVYKLFAEYKDTLIVVLLEDIPDGQLSRYDKVHRILKRNTYLQWPDDMDEESIERRTFWVRLKSALRGGRRAEDVNV